jgi:DNA-binding NarL/FixJ family response regulator
VAVIIVIEDPHITKVGLIQLLKENYYDVVAVNSAEDAITALDKYSPLAVITDIHLPNRSGLDFLEKIMQGSKDREIQFFIYTSEIDIKTESALKRLKIFNFFSKKRDVKYVLNGLEQYYREALQKQQQHMQGNENGSNEDMVDTLVAFQELHRGLQQQLPRDDSYTHYELGITYMEMGLINSAMREFQIAARSPNLFQGACYLIAQCFLQKNMLNEAIQSLQQGLSRDANGEEAVGLRYEMATTYRALGQKKEALSCFRQVHEKAGDFRDTGRFIKELEKELAQPQADRG